MILLMNMIKIKLITWIIKITVLTILDGKPAKAGRGYILNFLNWEVMPSVI